jgi:hypothetical protein
MKIVFDDDREDIVFESKTEVKKDVKKINTKKSKKGKKAIKK